MKTGEGDVTALPAGAGMPCHGCFQTGRPLRLRYYRRVVGMVFADRIHGTAGYFCVSCRRRQFGKHMSLTLLLGWWGLIALCFRNPYAIVTNLWALFAPPFGAGRLGAMNVNEIRADAREQQRLADVYMSMPSWFEHIDEDAIELILTEHDYYATLRVPRTATRSRPLGANRSSSTTPTPPAPPPTSGWSKSTMRTRCSATMS